jgi:hypothetical protein
MPILRGGGSYPTPGHVTRKQTVNTTLARPSALLEIYFLFSHTSSTPITIQYYFSDWGKQKLPGSIPGDKIISALPSWTPIGEIGSTNLSLVYCGNRKSLQPMMFIDLKFQVLLTNLGIEIPGIHSQDQNKKQANK